MPRRHAEILASWKEGINGVLSSIPPAALEVPNPTAVSLHRETLRRAQLHTAVPRNTGTDLPISAYTIPYNAFVLYPFSGTVLNRTLYPNPFRWDPGRTGLSPDIADSKT